MAKSSRHLRANCWRAGMSWLRLTTSCSTQGPLPNARVRPAGLLRECGRARSRCRHLRRHRRCHARRRARSPDVSQSGPTFLRHQFSIAEHQNARGRNRQQNRRALYRRRRDGGGAGARDRRSDPRRRRRGGRFCGVHECDRLNIRAVSIEYGRASAMKLCRSIVVKGLEVVSVECGRAAAFFDVADEVFGSLEATYAGMGWAALAENSLERVSNHGLRRAAEMREAAEIIADMGLDPALARAIAAAQERGAKSARDAKKPMPLNS